MRLDDIMTPALVLNRAVLGRNISAMSERMRRHGVALRPHLKTAKCAEVARLATAGQFGGITVSTLREAAFFAERGFHDITYAVGIVPSKVDQAVDLVRQGVSLRLLTDDPGVAQFLAVRSTQLEDELRVLIEVDTGLHRTGVEPDSPELLEIARIVHAAPRLHLDGVLTHAGHAYHCSDVAGVRAVAEAERRGVVAAAERLRKAGLPCPTVSAGSTPTAVHAESLQGVTEMRPGNYVFFDLAQVGLGSCRVEDVALTVLATVIGHSRRHGRILIDAGSLALSSDTSANEHTPGVGYGLVRDARGVAPGSLHVAHVNQEHGYVESPEPLPFDALPIGSRVRILPNHSCITAAMYDRYHVVDGSDEVVDTWERTNRW
jgi:D-serine deaminase-like pyridoxal phosphate-dependent protein